MLEELSALVLPIDALLAHHDFKPQESPSTEVVALFRNMWFILALFRLTSEDKTMAMNDWQKAALARIATKTPTLVLESAHDYINSDIEYNPVVRKDYSQHVSTMSVCVMCILFIVPILVYYSFRSSPNTRLF